MDDSDHPIFISALQHYAYCPRQFALIHVEQAWEENRFTAEGKLLHERVDSGVAEQRGAVRSERGVLLKSQQYKLTGKMDLLEVEQLNNGQKYIPVEYKRGKPKVEDWDRIQLCAQALCIEEMRNTTVVEGAIWYWEVRRRTSVLIDEVLRKSTVAAINGAHELMRAGKTPEPITDKQRCRACSLKELCNPDAFRQDTSSQYVDTLFLT